MSCLATPNPRLPLRIQSLVSLTSILFRIQPIASLVSTRQPIGTLHSSSARPPTTSPAHAHQTPAPGGGTLKGGHTSRCPITSQGNLNRPIGGQYMCGNYLSSMASSKPAIIQPKGQHTGTVIFLHGLGDQGYGWAESFDMIKEPHIKYIFPHADSMSVTLNMGMVMPSWFDILSLGVGGSEDEDGIRKASEALAVMIAEEESKGIPTNRIVIGGFSQGGGVSLYKAISSDKQFAGILALSTWMPMFKKFKTDGVTKKALPILQCHGTSDPLLPFSLGQMTHEFLKTQAENPEFRAFQGLAHSSSLEEMHCVRDFLRKVLP